MRNVEFKAELRDPGLARAIVLRLGAGRVATVEQTDTYYRVPHGRLKRRECPGEPVEVIAYERPDGIGARTSEYTIHSEQDAIARFGTLGLPIWLEVRKTREIFLLGSVRIHLDEVRSLGRFLELESLVIPADAIEEARRRLETVRAALAPALGEPIARGYADMVADSLEAGEEVAP